MRHVYRRVTLSPTSWSTQLCFDDQSNLKLENKTIKIVPRESNEKNTKYFRLKDIISEAIYTLTNCNCSPIRMLENRLNYRPELDGTNSIYDVCQYMTYVNIWRMSCTCVCTAMTNRTRELWRNFLSNQNYTQLIINPDSFGMVRRKWNGNGQSQKPFDYNLSNWRMAILIGELPTKWSLSHTFTSYSVFYEYGS